MERLHDRGFQTSQAARLLKHVRSGRVLTPLQAEGGRGQEKVKRLQLMPVHSILQIISIYSEIKMLMLSDKTLHFVRGTKGNIY